MRKGQWRKVLLALALAGLAGGSRADERIVSFRSDIAVRADSTVRVTERITVTAEGNQIRHGIFRDFPTRYRDRFGNRVTAGFDVLDVRRDDQPEAYRLENLRNGRRIRIGQKDVTLPPGTYTYVIDYRTNRQLGFFPDHDELYWNVTGNGWVFPIDRAEANVVLPAGVDPKSVSASGYTGPAGSKAAALTASVSGPPAGVHVVTTRPLGANEGLTIVVTWPKGFVQPPAAAARLRLLLADNPTLGVALAGLLLTLAYFLASWFAVGRDPEKGTIVPTFVPPQGVSPAAARFVMRMGYDDRCFAAALINLAVRRWITLEEHAGVYTVRRAQQSGGAISPAERSVFDTLLHGRDSLTLQQAHHETIAAAIAALRKALKGEHAQRSFHANGKFLIPGVLLGLLTLAGVVYASGSPDVAFLGFWISIWSIGVVILLRMCWLAWAKVFAKGGAGACFGALFQTAFTLPFLLGEGAAGYQLTLQTSLPTALAVIALAASIWIFHHLLKAPTRVGRQLMDTLEGLKLYLSVAEADRLAALNPPEKTPELFEAFLPFALALDVEQKWAEKFSDVLTAAGQTPSDSSYRPIWYASSSGRGLTPAALAGAVGGALAVAVSSSSTAPGSSSGGGGGGSSGGGGGGGGGGGW